MNEDYKRNIDYERLARDFTLEDILAEYRQELSSRPRDDESLSTRSKRIVMEALDQTISEAGIQSLDDIVEDTVARSAGTAEPEIEEIFPAEPETPAKAAESLPAEPEAEELTDAEEDEAYAEADAAEARSWEDEGPAASKQPLSERVLAPLTALLALVAVRREQRRRAERHAPTEEREDEHVPEMAPEKAMKVYAAQLRSLKLRTRIAAALSLVMVYLSFAFTSRLPLAGALNGSVRVMSLTLLIFQLTVMVVALDTVTAGLLALARRRPNFDTLAAASALLSVLDAAALAVMNSGDFGLPFCAVSALSLTFSLWGSYLTCRGYRSSFRVLAMSKRLYAVTGESGIVANEVALLKSRRGVQGFVSRSEEADLPEYVYAVLTPVALALAVVLGLLASVAHAQPRAALHCISIIAATAAAFSAAVCFALPFSVTARRLFQSGAAIAGWSGVRDIGKSRHVVITDSDVFPQGTVEISGIRILEGAFTDKVISYTGSVIAASGSGLAQPFSELIRRNGYSISRVEDFRPHDGGGMIAMVNGESVYVGSTGFMNLMGIRVPQKLASKSAVYAAISGSLVGIFNINYHPISSVQDALVLLLRSNREPIFAIRDFNITPLMIKRKFNMPTDEFEFPSYSERYRISGAEPDENSKIAAVVSREGMGPLVDAADRGRRLYGAVRVGTAISAAATGVGVLLMFFLCWAGAFDSATVGNVLLFMLLWLIPELVLCWGLQR